jgi:hypothetical protein
MSLQALQIQNTSSSYEQRRHTRIVTLPKCETREALLIKQQLPN